MLGELIDLLDELRKAYGDFQDRSLTGQSPMDRQSRRLVNFGCGLLIAILVVAGTVWACLGGW